MLRIFLFFIHLKAWLLHTRVTDHMGISSYSEKSALDETFEKIQFFIEWK